MLEAPRAKLVLLSIANDNQAAIREEASLQEHGLASADIADYIESFDNRSRHKHIAGVSPEDFEAAAR
jgi:hypothetical protein